MRRWRLSAVVVLVMSSAVALRAAEPASPLEAVKDGVVVVYAVDDLTTPILDDGPVPTAPPTAQSLADDIGKLVRETIGVGAWTADGDSGAAMVITPRQITIKAPQDLHGQVAGLLGKLREQRSLFVEFDFRVVESAWLSNLFRSVAPGVTSLTLDADMVAKVDADAKTIVGQSRQTVTNGVMRTLLDQAGHDLPTLLACPTISADRKQITFSLSVATAAERTHPQRMINSVPSGATAAIPLDPAHTRWLILTCAALRSTPPQAM